MRTTRDETIKEIRTALKNRTGMPWSVTGGRGTAWGWIRIQSPPRRRVGPFGGEMTDDDRALLGKALGLDRPVHCQGESIPSGGDYYEEYLQRARGQKPDVIGKPYWD